MQRYGYLRVSLALAVVAITSTACGTGVRSGLGGGVTPNVIAGVDASALAFSHVPGGDSLLGDAAKGLLPFATVLTAGDVSGTGAASNLQSLQYFIQSIELCEKMTFKGSGYEKKSGCIKLYNFENGPNYNDFLVTQAQADTSAGWIDLMTAEGQAKLRKPLRVTSSMVGSYKYGLINWYTPIKVKADFPPISGTTTYHTKAKTSSRVLSGEVIGTEVITISDPSQGTAELMTYQLPNGGSTFPFIKPFVITKEDVKNQVAIKMDLVFNPANMGYAVAGSGTTCNMDSIYQPVCGINAGAGHIVTMDFPMLRMSPVPRKSGEKTFKETYTVANYETGLDLRVEVYYNSADADKTPSGLDVTTIYKAGATKGNTGSKPYSYMVDNLADNTLILRNYDGSESMRFLRRQSSAVDATFTCMSTDTACTATHGASSFTKSITYTPTDTLVSAD